MLNFARARRANMSGNEPGADTAMALPLRSSILSMPALTMMPCGTTTQWQPMIFTSPPRTPTAKALDAAFVAVELAGEQRFEPDLVVFHFEQFELEALAFRKAALGCHQQEAGIGLGRDDPVFPWFRRLRRRRAGGSGKHRARRYQSRQDGHFHLLASSLSLSARQRPFIKIPVKAHALAPAAPDCERSAPPLALRTKMEPP